MKNEPHSTYQALGEKVQEIGRLKQELAAEQEKRKPLVDALELLKQKSREGYTVSSSVIQFICDEAMEKMKEK